MFQIISSSVTLLVRCTLVAITWHGAVSLQEYNSLLCATFSSDCSRSLTMFQTKVDWSRFAHMKRWTRLLVTLLATSRLPEMLLLVLAVSSITQLLVLMATARRSTEQCTQSCSSWSWGLRYVLQASLTRSCSVPMHRWVCFLAF